MVKQLVAHACADLFPLLEGEEFDKFKKDVALNGVLTPIVLHEGRIIDGRNRYRACQELGKECPTREWEPNGMSVPAFIWSMNGERNHLSQSEKAAIAVEMLPYLEEEAKERKRAGGEHGHEGGRGNKKTHTEKMPEGFDDHSGEAREQAAKLVGTNAKYVSSAKVLKRENPDLFEKVRKGEMGIPQALEVRRKQNPDLRRPELSKSKKADKESGDKCWDIIDRLYQATKRPTIVAPYSELKSLIAELRRLYAAHYRP